MGTSHEPGTLMTSIRSALPPARVDRKSTRLNSSHSLHDALPISDHGVVAVLPGHFARDHGDFPRARDLDDIDQIRAAAGAGRSEEHTSELQSLPTRRSSDLRSRRRSGAAWPLRPRSWGLPTSPGP